MALCPSFSRTNVLTFSRVHPTCSLWIQASRPVQTFTLKQCPWVSHLKPWGPLTSFSNCPFHKGVSSDGRWEVVPLPYVSEAPYFLCWNTHSFSWNCSICFITLRGCRVRTLALGSPGLDPALFPAPHVNLEKIIGLFGPHALLL